MSANDPTDQPAVVDVPARNRFELLLDGELVGLADYHLVDEVLVVPHVETDPVHRGKGFAAVLMAGVLDAVRERGRTIRPICPYAADYMRRHPDNEDLRADI